MRFLTANAAAQIQRDDEYLDPADGLLHCKTCHGLRQTVIPAPGGTGVSPTTLPVPLPECCGKQRKAAEEKTGASGTQASKSTWVAGSPPLRLHVCQRQRKNARADCQSQALCGTLGGCGTEKYGLLLFGDVGTGKSFLAGCIANALLEQDVPVLMTNFPTILNRMTGLFGSDRADFLANLNAYDLLILDDLGAERGTEYALEQVFAVIDARYRSRKTVDRHNKSDAGCAQAPRRSCACPHL